MRRVDRLWIRAIELGIDDNLVNLLAKLRVIKNKEWVHFKEVSHVKLIEYRNAKNAKRSRHEARDHSIPMRAPRSIKPTKNR